MNASLKHHILSSEYFSNLDLQGNDYLSKYIDLVPDFNSINEI